MDNLLARLGLSADRLPDHLAAWQHLLGALRRRDEDSVRQMRQLEAALDDSAREMRRLCEDLTLGEARLAADRDRLEAVLGAVGAGVCVFDHRGELRFANAVAARQFDRDPAELRGQPVWQQLRDHRGRPLQRAQVAHPDTELRVHEGQLQLGDGRVLLVEFVLTPVSSRRRSQGSVLLLRDIRAEVDERALLRSSKDQAEAENRRKSEFLAVMTHELRTPLSGILGLTHLLLDTALAPEARELALGIQQSGDTLLAVIGDILDLSKIEAGRLEIEREAFVLRQPFEQALDIVAPVAQQKGIEVALLVPPELPERVVGDAARLRQVALNLFGNAAKFTAQGSIVVTLAVVARGEAGLRLRAEVTDSGIGIEPAAQQHLFQPFTQADSSTTRHFGGTGLGLAISRRLIELHGGAIGCRSRSGQGSTFWFEFEVGEAPAPAEPALPSLRVLFVDGHEATRTAAAHSCESLGVQAVSVAGGADALAWLREAAADSRLPDVVLAGERLADGRGHQFLTALAGDPALQRLPRWLLEPWSARGDAGDRHRAHVDHVLAKPLRRDELRRALARLCAPDQTAVPQPATTAGHRPALVLVAEDNPVSQKVAASMLRKRGHQVLVVNNGNEAVKALSTARFDLVLMDCHMPEMDGFQATAAIRSHVDASTARTPIVALTANSLPGDVDRCMQAGMDDYVRKPLTPQRLDEVIERWSGAR